MIHKFELYVNDVSIVYDGPLEENFPKLVLGYFSLCFVYMIDLDYPFRQVKQSKCCSILLRNMANI